MLIIKILSEENGGHANQKYDNPICIIPEGWALVPDDMIIPETFPFVNIEVDGQVVTYMEASVVPPIPPQPDPQPTEDVWDSIADAIRQGVNQA